MKKRPNILTIAGLDPSSGAGLTADIKTFEALKCYGFSVCTATTVQNDIEFKTCYWTPVEVIKEQAAILLDRFSIEFVKIGIVENWMVLHELVDFLVSKNPEIKIVLDPILSSSSQHEFHSGNDSEATQNLFEKVLEKIYLLTPNYKEIEQLYPHKTITETIQHISSKTHLLVKGGHKEHKVGVDELFTLKGKDFKLNPKNNFISEKHGSGCVLSSAITAYLALGFPLLKACYRGKRYTEKVLSSNKSLLGYHG